MGIVVMISFVIVVGLGGLVGIVGVGVRFGWLFGPGFGTVHPAIYLAYFTVMCLTFCKRNLSVVLTYAKS